MPIPTSITDLSTTPASNSPSGSENPIEGDNHLRTAYSFIRQLYDGITASGNVTLAQLADDSSASAGAGLVGAYDAGGFYTGTTVLAQLQEAGAKIMMFLPSLAALESASIPSSVNTIYLDTYSATGDGGYTIYSRVGSEPSHAGKAQSTDGAWWEIGDNYPWMKSFGASMDGATDDAAALTDAASMNADFTGVGKLFRATTTEVPNGFAFGHLPHLLRGRNIVTNGNFNTWQRFDANAISSLAYSPPTFGNSATYEGTGGLRVTSADLWRAQVFGASGSGTISRAMLSATETALGDGSEFYARWVATSITPPAATETTITAATTPATSPVTITAAGHGLSNGDYRYIENSTYTGGNGTLNGTYQVSNVSGDNFDITVTPDAGFSAWTAFGNLTNDPDNTTFEHVYDPAVSLWVRNGTSSHIFQYRAPQTRFPGGIWTVRLRMKRISGDPLIRARLYYDFGSGGSPSATTSTVALLANPTSGTSVIDYIGVVDIGSIGASTFGTTRNTGYMAVSLEANPTDFDVVLYSVSARPGVGSIPNDGWTRQEAYPIHELYYRTVVGGHTNNFAAGEYNSTVVSLSPPMAGTPTINKLSDIALTAGLTATTIDQARSDSFRLTTQATPSAVAIGQYKTQVEVIYEIPT